MTAARIVPIAGERWWGGRVLDGLHMPYPADHTGTIDLSASGSPDGNQVQPLLISNKGRYIWSDQPFSFGFENGSLQIEASATLDVGKGCGSSLRDGFIAAQKHFPPSGAAPALGLFTAPQYNTWIELLYDQSQERILRYARDLIGRGYSPGVLMIDDNWQEDYGVWRFSGQRFPDPRAMMTELKSLGFQVMLWTCPFVSPDSSNFRWLAQHGLLLREELRSERKIWTGTAHDAALIRWWNGASAVLDLSNPEAVAWYTSQLRDLVNDYGVAGFKFDAGDSSFYLPERGRGQLHSHLKRTPEEHTEDFARIGLQFPFNEYRACWKMAGQPLGQRLRDKEHSWDALAELIPGVLSQGLMGYAFSCPDLIGGGHAGSFEDASKFDGELIVRSAQVHALMPMMQFSVAPWRVLSSELAEECRKAALLHLREAPRIERLVREAAVTGEPIVRPLAWGFPESGYEDIKDQFLLGRDLMVAPVITKGARSRRVQIPPGTWKADDGSITTGPATSEITANLGRLPYFQLIG